MKSYSQHGEDVIAVRYFDYHGPLKGIYVDIGCFHPVRHSNTYLLHQKGRGVSILTWNPTRSTCSRPCVDPTSISAWRLAIARVPPNSIHQPESIYGSMEGLGEATVQ